MSDVIVGFLLDRSGSMHSIWEDAVGGTQAFLDEQSAVEGNAYLYLSVFDTEYTNLVDGRLVQEVHNPLNGVAPRGGTALRDATANLINEISAMQERERFAPNDVVIVVMTDGYENSSREYSQDALSKLIKDKESAGWKFIYLGANQDAWSVGTNMGFNAQRSFNWDATKDGTKFAYGAVSSSLASYRQTGLESDLTKAGGK